jgi:Zn-dependent M28 family amino/carboxypeptidase
MGIDPDGTIYNGANDNASGVAVVLEIARLWQAQGFQPKRSVLFVAWDAEEKRVVGATHYVENPIYPLDHTAAVNNLDMAGIGDQLVIFGPEPIASQLGASAEVLGFTPIIDPATASGGSDEIPFIEAGIPAGGYTAYPVNDVDLAYHLPDDDAHNVQPETLWKIGACSAHFLATWTGGGPTK